MRYVVFVQSFLRACLLWLGFFGGTALHILRIGFTQLCSDARSGSQFLVPLSRRTFEPHAANRMERFWDSFQRRLQGRELRSVTRMKKRPRKIQKHRYQCIRISAIRRIRTWLRKWDMWMYKTFIRLFMVPSQCSRHRCSCSSILLHCLSPDTVIFLSLPPRAMFSDVVHALCASFCPVADSFGEKMTSMK
jgi:hypothetical protein